MKWLHLHLSFATLSSTRQRSGNSRRPGSCSPDKTKPEGVEPGFSGATLTGPNKEQIKTGKASRSEQDKTQLIIPLAQTLEAGKYTVDWHVVSVDGHKTKGQYTFSVK